MSRNALLLFSAICWIGVAAVAVAHIVAGDYLVPAVMGLVFIVWVTVRQRHYSHADAEAVPVEA